MAFYNKFYRQLLIWLLLAAISKVCYAIDHSAIKQRYTLSDDDREFQFIFVTQSGDIIVHQHDTLLQFHNGNISADAIINHVNVTQIQNHNHYEPKIVRPFVYRGTRYLLICHFVECSAYDQDNINSSHVLSPYNSSPTDVLLKEKTNAQLVVHEKNTDISFFTAVTDPSGVSTISLSWPEDGDVKVRRIGLFRSKENTGFDFVFSFISSPGDKVYFLRNVEDASGKRKVMISQMCPIDTYLRSYIESNLTCGYGYTRIVSATVIVDRYLALAMTDNTHTRLCVFDIHVIEQHFNQTLRSCFVEAKGSWPSWIKTTDGKNESSCSTPNYDYYQCGHTSDNTKILTEVPLTTQNYSALDNGLLEHSMVFRNYASTVYGYIGFQTGIVWKVIFNEVHSVIARLERITVSNEPFKQLVFNNNGSSLFYITAKTMGKIKVDPTCPPSIESIEPLNGTISGGTALTLTGKFSIHSDVFKPSTTTLQRVTIGDRPCLNVSVESTTRITCVTPSQHVSQAMDINVTIEEFQKSTFVCRGTSKYKVSFVYLEPTLDNSTVNEPQRVKLSGCIPISVYGDNLDIGTTRQMMVGERRCTIIHYNRTMIECLAPEQSSVGNYPITVILDNTNLTGPMVTYIPEPTITDMQPKYTTISGGIVLTITGEHLDGLGSDTSLQLQGVSKTCSTNGNESSLTIECVTPKVRSNSMEHLYLHNDYCMNVSIETPLLVVEDPVFEENNQEIHDKSKHDQLFFRGSKLDHIRGTDITVTVGDTQCHDIEVYNDKISCNITYGTILQNNFIEKVYCYIGYGKYYLGTVAFISSGSDENVGTSPANNDDDNYKIIILGTLIPVMCGICLAVYTGRRLYRRRKLENFAVHFDNTGGDVLSLEGLSVSETTQNRQNDYMSATLMHAAENTNAKEAMPWTPLLSQSLKDMLDHSELLIAKENLVLGESIGRGHFGCVYKGYLQQEDQKSERIVACKTLLRNNPEELDVDAFLEEALVMKDFHHRNVMELIGICLGIKTLPLVVLPFMRKGDVLSYIRDVSNQPTVKQLVLFAIDIANGMDYLAQLKFVHRDLAARNCMIDEDMTVKVADFGLSRDVYEKEYYTSCDKKAKLPVKWMSPESLEFGKYTSKSDVWSFGVLMWELFTRGINPYPTVDGWDILRYLSTGRRLSKPQFCHDEMYRILQSCWVWEPEDRPTFGELTVSIPALLTKLLEKSSIRRKMSSRSESKDEGHPCGSHGHSKVRDVVEKSEKIPEDRLDAGTENGVVPQSETDTNVTKDKLPVLVKQKSADHPNGDSDNVKISQSTDIGTVSTTAAVGGAHHTQLTDENHTAECSKYEVKCEANVRECKVQVDRSQDADDSVFDENNHQYMNSDLIKRN